MKIFTTKQSLKVHISKLKAQDNCIGFVPTMGALHKGHLSLIEKAKKKNNFVVVSIFVNPTQFNSQEDLENYPKNTEEDIKLLQDSDCDILFIPSVEEIYHANIVSKKFDFDGLENQMEGKFRTGHFNGVGTIVKTLFEIVEPDRAYFGQKDFQQLQIIKKMVKKYRLNVKIKGCPIFRESDGLAMSSRNTRLSKEQRKEASFVYKTLKKASKKSSNNSIQQVVNWVEKEFKNHDLFDLEYFTIAEEKSLKSVNQLESDKKYRAFIAVFAGKIRLIDNIRLKK